MFLSRELKLPNFILSSILYMIWILFILPGPLSHLYCPPGQFLHPTKLACSLCPATATSSYPYSLCLCLLNNYKNVSHPGYGSDSSCVASNLADNQIYSQYDLSAVPTSGSIKTCVSTAYPSQNLCLPCNKNAIFSSVTKKCACPNLNFQGFCFTSTTVLPTLDTSYIYKDIYGSVTLGCVQQGSSQACSALLSLCALKGYSDVDPFCIQYNKYKASFESASLQDSITDQITLDVNSPSLQFYTAKYDSISGKLLSFNATDGTQFGCILSANDLRRLSMVGYNLSRTCKISIQSQPFISPTFQLYVKTSLGFVNVPVLIGDVKVPRTRFAVCNTMFSRKDFNDFNSSTSVDVVTSLTLTYSFDKTKGLLKVPVLSLVFKNQPFSDYSLQIAWGTIGDSSGFFSTIIPLFIVFNVLAGLAALYRLVIYIRQNPEMVGQLYYCFRTTLATVIILGQTWSLALFGFLMLASGYWFFFFKFQSGLFVFMTPQTTFSDYFPYDLVFFLVFIINFITYIARLIKISGLELYFIDWERSKSEEGQIVTQKSIWRIIFCAKRLVKLTLYRKTSPFLVMLILGFFLTGLDWRYLAYQNSYPETSRIAGKQLNYVILHFLASSIYILACLVLGFLRWAVKIWFPLPHEDFQDLLSLSNLSLIIFDNNLHGFYIHGQHPIGKAQGSIEYHNQVLAKQSKNIKTRAFIEDQEQQIFQILVPIQLRNDYNVILANKIREMLLEAGQRDGQIFSRPIPSKSQNFEDLQINKQQLNRYLKLYLDEMRKQHKRRVVQKPFFISLSGCVPSLEDIGKLPIFYKERPAAASYPFVGGSEPFFVLTEALIINFWLRIVREPMQGMLLAGLCNLLIVQPAFEWFVLRNVASKTFVDIRLLNN